MAVGCDVRIVTEQARFEPRFFGLGLTSRRRQYLDAAPAGQLEYRGRYAAVFAVPQRHGGGREGSGLEICCEADQLVEEAFAFTANIRDLPKELLLRTKQTLRQAGGTNSHKEILDVETTENRYGRLTSPMRGTQLTAMIDKISSK